MWEVDLQGLYERREWMNESKKKRTSHQVDVTVPSDHKKKDLSRNWLGHGAILK